MSLLERIPALVKSGTDFAYFVTFDDEKSIYGKERLFIGGNLVKFDESKHFLCRSATSKADYCPVIITFDYAMEIFPGIPLKESTWPKIMVLQPDVMLEGEIRRADTSDSIIPGRENADKKVISAIVEAREKIITGELLQVVLSKEFQTRHNSPVKSLKTYLTQDRSKYVYYYKFGSYEVFGSSPESLVRLNKGIATLNPIAGTRDRGRNTEEDSNLEHDLRVNGKELCEHRMLVDLSRNDLMKVCQPGTVEVVTDQKIRKYRSVQHIVSEVRGNLNHGECLDSLVYSVFPAGTVSGAPKKRALELIAELETTARGPYSGAIGIIGKDFLDLAITIRTCYGNDGAYITRAGAGIVKDSVPENELHEMFQKASTVI